MISLNHITSVVLRRIGVPALSEWERELVKSRDAVTEIDGVIPEDGKVKIPIGWQVFEVELQTPNSWKSSSLVGYIRDNKNPLSGSQVLGVYAFRPLTTGESNSIIDPVVKNEFISKLQALGADHISFNWKGVIKADFSRAL